MRGPGLVGYPPGALRWSGDSERLYFEWRPRGEDEPATWEVARACLGAAAVPAANAAAPAAKTCEPRRLTDDERRLAPPAGGEWDPAHRRSVGIVDGDVVVVDTVARTRTLITRTAAAEAHARWSDGGRAVTFVRDGGLHRVWVDRRPDQPGDRGDGHGLRAAHRRGAAQAPPADHRQPAVPQVRGGAAPRRRPRERSAEGAGGRPQGRPGGGARGRRRAAVGRRSGARAPGQGGLRAGRRQAGGVAPRRRPVLRHRIELSGAAARPAPRRRRAGGPPSGGRRPGGEERHHGVAERRRDRSARRSAPLEPAGGVGRRQPRRDHRRLGRQQAPLRRRARPDARHDADRRAPARHRVGARARRVRPAADHDGLRARHGAALVPVRARRLDAPLRRRSRRARTRRRGSSRAAPGRSPTRSSRPTAGSS